MHIKLDEELVADLDRRAGPRGRSAFITLAIRRALEDEQRWDELEQALGTLPDSGHDWDADPAAWVRQQRFADDGRVG